ncbi:MAG: hypothetical protein ACOX2E_03255 [Syntrophaceticus sp.]|jgi:hypothetical protein
MSRKGRKRLDVWLPEDHPIFLYPPGSRARVVRNWLEIGEKLSKIEEKMEQLVTQKVEANKDEEQVFDPSGFAEIINNVFR